MLRPFPSSLRIDGFAAVMSINKSPLTCAKRRGVSKVAVAYVVAERRSRSAASVARFEYFFDGLPKEPGDLKCDRLGSYFSVSIALIV